MKKLNKYNITGYVLVILIVALIEYFGLTCSDPWIYYPLMLINLCIIGMALMVFIIWLIDHQ